MGAVNYGTSDYITMGIEPMSAYDLEHDEELMDEIRAQVDEYGGTIEDAIYDYINDCAEDDFNNIQAELDNHDFWYFHIVIKRGYYEGFYLDIENNFPVAFNDWRDRAEAQKEITEIKQFLIDCAGLGLREVWPGWCTKYQDYSHTIEAIKKAVREMRDEVKTTPTWRQYERDAA